MADADRPLSTIYALEHGTRLRIRPLGGEWRVVQLNPGDLLVFRMGYAKPNLRVHAYIYKPGCKSASALHPCP